MKQEILNKLNLGEDHERECKLATGGLPESIRCRGISLQGTSITQRIEW